MAEFEIITTVTSAAASYDLVDLATVKTELQITGSSEDAALRRWISACSAAISQYCNRVFVKETVKDEFWPRRDPMPAIMKGGVDPLQLSRYPAVSVASVVENDASLNDAQDYRVNLAKGQVVRLNADSAYPRQWPAYPIVVEYDAGFSTLPADVVDATIRLVKARRDARGRDPFTRSVDIPGVRSVQYWVPDTPTGNMTPDIQDLLDNYRVPVIA